MTLSETALTLLNAAAHRDDRLVPRRANVPPIADINVSRALVKQGLLAIVRAPANATDVVTVREDDCLMAFLIADEGFRAVNLDPPASADIGKPEASLADEFAVSDSADPIEQGDAAAPCAGLQTQTPDDAPGGLDGAGTALIGAEKAMSARTTLRQAAAALLSIWSSEVATGAALPAAFNAPIESLRSLLAKHTVPVPAGQPRRPRKDTKQAAVLAMLRRSEGATIAQVMDVTGWASHTVRGFFAGLKKKGHAVEVLERVRQVGSGNQGARGSYTVYRVAEAG